MDSIREAIRGLFSSTIFIRKDYHANPDPDDKFGRVYCTYLKYSGKSYEVDTELSVDVRKGLVGASFEEAVLKETAKANCVTRRSTFDPLISLIVDDIYNIVSLIKASKDGAPNALIYRLHDLLTTVQMNSGTLGIDRGPRIDGAIVYVCVMSLLESSNETVAEALDDHGELVVFVAEVDRVIKFRSTFTSK